MTTVSRTTDSWFSRPGDGYDGVGYIIAGQQAGSGSLLTGGRAVLTAAHVLEGSSGAVSVSFDTAGGRVRLPVERYWIHADYDSGTTGNDLALLWLEAAAPLAVPRYDLYRQRDELGRVVDIVGYGAMGTGETGHTGASGTRTVVANRIEATWAEVNAQALGGRGWQPPPGSQLIADFDDGSRARDALGRLVNRRDTGLGDREGMIAPGDSGGPAFVDGRVAGVAGYAASISPGRGERIDLNDRIDSSYGELSAWQRVSFHQAWIDRVLAEAAGAMAASGAGTQAEDGGAPDNGAPATPVAIVGGAGPDLLIAEDRGSVLSGLAGNDRLRGGSGDDRFEGGTGIDVARIDVPRDAIRVVSRPGETLVVESSQGRDTLTGIELVRLADRVVPVYATDLATTDEGLWVDRRAYLEAHQDVAAAGVDPLLHYQRWGEAEGRNPNALFDERWYLEAHPDVAAAVARGDLASGYQHLVRWGGAEGRSPSPWMDAGTYLAANPDVAAAGIDPLSHFLQWGALEGRAITAADSGLWG